jgi:putative glutamine amidotransferase
MTRPVIGITMDYGDKPRQYMLPYDYATSIERAGGLPWPLPFKTDLSLIPEIVDRLEGIVFSGGDDLDPALYGETRHPNAEPIDPDRQRFELALIAEVERRRMPALGICLGCQLMNVHRGGSLIQFLPDAERADALEHRKLEGDKRRHTVELEPGTKLADAIGSRQITVNSRHKQAVARTGRGLRVIAKAPDGVVEAIEDPSHPFFMAVQWHPENLSDRPEHLAPFKLLVSSAQRSRQSGGQQTDK